VEHAPLFRDLVAKFAETFKEARVVEKIRADFLMAKAQIEDAVEVEGAIGGADWNKTSN